MGEHEQEILQGLELYFSFVPNDWWPWISVSLASLIFVSNVLNPIMGLVSNLYKFVRRLLLRPTGPVVEIEEPNRVNVLREVWLKSPDEERNLPKLTLKPPIPVVSFLNMKGGVGKTTLAANIGAHWQSAGNRVLFIDFDYQGTMSLMLAASVGMTRLVENSSQLLYDSDFDRIQNQARHLEQDDIAFDLFAAHYSLFRDEMHLFGKWASGEDKRDIRYSLARFLSNKRIKDYYDLVIIDCGPRFTTSTINALCASTHVVIPSLLDEPSTQAVAYLSKEFKYHKAELFPDLQLLGVIPTMLARDPNKNVNPDFNVHDLEQIVNLHDRMDDTWGKGDHVLEKARIPRRVGISRNADRVSYYVDEDAKFVFGRAGDELAKRLKNEGFTIKERT